MLKCCVVLFVSVKISHVLGFFWHCNKKRKKKLPAPRYLFFVSFIHSFVSCFTFRLEKRIIELVISERMEREEIIDNSYLMAPVNQSALCIVVTVFVEAGRLCSFGFQKKKILDDCFWFNNLPKALDDKKSYSLLTISKDTR